jgi:hypothetical protein
VSLGKTRRTRPSITSSEERWRRKNYEDFVVVWLDANIKKSAANVKAFRELRRIVSRLEIFDKDKECFQYVQKFKDEKVFMIVSGFLGEKFVPRLPSLAQIASVYLYCYTKDRHEKWAKSFPIVQGIYTDIGPLC